MCRALCHKFVVDNRLMLSVVEGHRCPLEFFAGHNFGTLHVEANVAREIALGTCSTSLLKCILIALQLFANRHLGNNAGPIRAFDPLATLQRIARGTEGALDHPSFGMVRVDWHVLHPGALAAARPSAGAGSIFGSLLVSLLFFELFSLQFLRFFRRL